MVVARKLIAAMPCITEGEYALVVQALEFARIVVGEQRSEVAEDDIRRLLRKDGREVTDEAVAGVWKELKDYWAMVDSKKPATKRPSNRRVNPTQPPPAPVSQT